MEESDRVMSLLEMTVPGLVQEIKQTEPSRSFGKHALGQSSRTARVRKLGSTNASPKRLQRRMTVTSSGNHAVQISTTSNGEVAFASRNKAEPGDMLRNARPSSWHSSVPHPPPNYYNPAPGPPTGNWTTSQTSHHTMPSSAGWPCGNYHQPTYIGGHASTISGEDGYLNSLAWHPALDTESAQIFSYAAPSIMPLLDGHTMGEAQMFDTSLVQNVKQMRIRSGPSNNTLFDTNDTTARSDKVLVGLGLYDKSETLPVVAHGTTPHSAILSDYSVVSSTGKGLKLEETWQPQIHLDTFENPQQSPFSDDGCLFEVDALDSNYFQYYPEINTTTLHSSHNMSYPSFAHPTSYQMAGYHMTDQTFAWPTDEPIYPTR